MGAILAQGAMDIGQGLVNTGLGMALGNYNDRRQLKQQRKLQNLQLEGSRTMMNYQAQKQLEMWKATSFKAQMEQLKEAGLNPGLVYAKGGTPGTTGSQGGGSASMGSSQMRREPRYMELGQSLMIGKQMEILEAQRKNIEADTANKQARTEGQGIRNEIARETKEEAKAIIRADNAITQSDKMITEIDAMIKYHIEGGQGGINPGKGEGYEIKTDALKQGASYKTILAEKGIKEAEERIQAAEADITEKLRSLGANNTTVNAIVQLIIAAMRKI